VLCYPSRTGGVSTGGINHPGLGRWHGPQRSTRGAERQIGPLKGTRLADSASWCGRVQAGRGSHPP